MTHPVQSGEEMDYSEVGWTLPGRVTGRRRRAPVSVVIATLNHEDTVGSVLQRLPPSVSEVIVVDRHSPDDTVAAALRARPDTRLILEPTPGRGAALRTGFAAARNEYVVVLDPGGSVDPLEIEEHVAALDRGHDVVKGSRFLGENGGPGPAHLGLLTLVNVLYRAHLTDLGGGLLSIRRRVLPVLRLAAAGSEIEIEIVVHALRAGLRTTEVPTSASAPRSGVRDRRRALGVIISTRRTSWTAGDLEDEPAGEEPATPAPPMEVSGR